MVETWLGPLLEEEINEMEEQLLVGEVGRNRNTRAKRKKCKLIKRKGVCPNLVLGVDIQIDSHAPNSFFVKLVGCSTA